LRIAIVQPGPAPKTVSGSNYFADLKIRTRKVIEEKDIPAVDLLIFPSDFFGFYPKVGFPKNPAETILGFNPQASTTIVGFHLQEDSKNYSTTAVVESSGRQQFTFKEHLFPFSDYNPFKFIKKVTPLAVEYSSRPNLPVELWGRVKLAVASCSEEFIPGLFRRFKKEGANLIIISGSNDDFAGPTAYQEVLRTGRLRALENGTWVVHAMKNGISAIIDPFGKVTNLLGKDEKGVLVGEVIIKN
jgi:apolipoprotein N-acyltransferase